MLIFKIIFLKIEPNDGLPMVLCEECVNLLDGYYQFYMQCQETEKALRQLKSTMESETNKVDIYFQVVQFEVNANQLEETSVSNESSVDTESTMAICEICMYKTNSLEIHQQLVHVGDPEESVILDYKCDLCGKLFLNEAAKKEHLRYFCPFMDTKSFICDFCNKSFTKKQALKMHLNLHLKSKEYPCKNCDKVYYSRSSLILHYRSHSIEPCPVCFKILKSYSLPHHMLQHSNDSRFKCQICNKSTFPTKASLKQHLKTHMRTSEPESLICDCGRKFNSVRGKQCHQANGCAAVSKENFSFKCEKCGKCFSKKNNLSRHLTTHNESSYKWKCGICDKKFNNSSNFKVHQFSHNSEKNIPCKYCKKMFKNQDSLRSHYVLHEGKMFSCKICEKTFTTHTLMNYHMMKKHEEEGF